MSPCTDCEATEAARRERHKRLWSTSGGGVGEVGEVKSKTTWYGKVFGNSTREVTPKDAWVRSLERERRKEEEEDGGEGKDGKEEEEYVYEI